MNRGDRTPRATYRLQFHRGFTLRDALDLVPYLDALGISHLYASPLLKARPGSPHGYDGIDPSQINPELGTEADLQLLAAALHHRGMGLVLDIVPNHLAAVPENPWWWDVLKRGRRSPFADHFDIDWDSPNPELTGKVLLPVLGDELATILDRCELTVVSEPDGPLLRYFDLRLPLAPESLAHSDGSTPFAVAQLNTERSLLTSILNRQHYRLASWRLADRDLNYRRFFTVNELAAVRVESTRVFHDTHQLILDWYQRGWIDGFRVDHPDGLSDPQRYLEELRRAAPDAWIVVEKILAPGESLPRTWPVAGTTGYDFLNRVTGLFVTLAGEAPLTRFYAEFSGEPIDFASLLRDCKRDVLQHQLVAEVTRLLRHFERAAADTAHPGQPTPTAPEDLHRALVELVAALPVYRTYLRNHGPNPASSADRSRMRQAVDLAASDHPELRDALECLRLRLLGHTDNADAAEFIRRFQQLTGPAMAKGAEDTAFYRFNRFVALNEVGGDPSHFGCSLSEFHGACLRSIRTAPEAMLATSTHDTKRSEDVRARLTLLSEIPEAWSAAVQRWSALNEPRRRDDLPDRNAEYLLYQTLVGAWPLTQDRLLAYLEKAAREAKQHSSWTQLNAPYETALREFAIGALHDPEFLQDLERFIAPLIPAGQINSLAQTLLKLTAPGVPDLYQGTELLDLTLVDPDNRRAVDFAARRAALDGLQRRGALEAPAAIAASLLGGSVDGRCKLFLIREVLQFRRQHEAVFREGGYRPLEASGSFSDRVVAFAREHPTGTAFVVVPRLTFALTSYQGIPPLGDDVWANTELLLPRVRSGAKVRNVFTGEILPSGSHSLARLRLADVFRTFPVALLEYLPAKSASSRPHL